MITRKWVNTEADDGALPALLERVADRIGPGAIDELWIFPTRRSASVESTVLVVSAFHDDGDRRRVWTAHFTIVRDGRGRPTVSERLEEHATAPTDALPRIVEGVVRRLGDDAARPPRATAIAGDVVRWADAIRALGGSPRDRTGTAGSDGSAGPAPAAPAPAGASGDAAARRPETAAAREAPDTATGVAGPV
jgi:hypothetical protein